jgi:high-affinity Fe2+/Pb2+ permease
MHLPAVRYGIPAVLVVAGFVILFTVDGNLRWDGWAMCVGAGLSILLLNILFRFGSKGDRERQDEIAARDYFDRHGRWPDDS